MREEARRTWGRPGRTGSLRSAGPEQHPTNTNDLPASIPGPVSRVHARGETADLTLTLGRKQAPFGQDRRDGVGQ